MSAIGWGHASAVYHAPSKVATTGAWSLVPNSRRHTHDEARPRHRVAGEDVVEAPADVALAQVAPRRPPGEERVVVGIERAPDVDQAVPEQPLEERALVGALADRVRLALLRVHVALRRARR